MATVVVALAVIASIGCTVIPQLGYLSDHGTRANFKGAGLVGFPGSCGDIAATGLSWYYNWRTEDGCRGTSGAEFVPMLWGDWCADGSDCSTVPNRLAASGASTILGFNEPDNAVQSNMSVGRALDLWSVLSRTGLRLGSPAVSVDPPERGRQWLEQFMQGARSRGLRIDFLAAHWYGDCGSVANLTSFLDDLHARFALPIWLTEFSCWHASQELNRSFLAGALPALTRLDYLERIGWFTNRPFAGGWENSALFSNSGLLTPVGQVYRNSTG